MSMNDEEGGRRGRVIIGRNREKKTTKNSRMSRSGY